MKIGILTYHQADNFGAVIQSYALSQYLNSQGFYAEIINYDCKAIKVHYQIFSPAILWSRRNVFYSLEEYLSRFTDIQNRIIRRRKFKMFRNKYLRLSPLFRKIKEPLDYDVIVVGSDQVWNFFLNKGDEKIYLLGFPCYPNTKKIAYAASSEENGLNRIDVATLETYLSKFDKISVREVFLKDKLSIHVKQNIEVCLDPVFLLEKSDYLNIAQYNYSSKYILIYHMSPISEILPEVENIAKLYSCEILEIYGGFGKGRKRKENVILDWGPEEVLGLIANAFMIFTTSFHGLAMSLIMEKNVWVINKGNNLRQKNLLDWLGLNERLLETMENFKFEEIDYQKVHVNLEPIIHKSKSFLKI